MVDFSEDPESQPETDQQLVQTFENAAFEIEEERARENELDDVPENVLEVNRHSHIPEELDYEENPQILPGAEYGPRRWTETARKAFEEDLFADMLGFDYDRAQVDLPGEFNVELMKDEEQIKVEYRVNKKSDITQESNPANSFFEYFVAEGELDSSLETEYFEMDLELGQDPYLELEMQYDEQSNEGRKMALQRMEELQELLTPR